MNHAAVEESTDEVGEGTLAALLIKFEKAIPILMRSSQIRETRALIRICATVIRTNSGNIVANVVADARMEYGQQTMEVHGF